MKANFEKINAVYFSGVYVQMIRNAQPKTKTKDDNQQNDISVKHQQGSEEAAYLLRQLTEAAQEVEEQAALAEPPFQYIKKNAEAHRGNMKLFFRLRLLKDDYCRLVDKKAVILERIDTLTGKMVLLRVENLSAGPDEIIVSTQKQVEEIDFPSNGELRLGTIPILKKARESVIDSLMDGGAPNPWLLPAISGRKEYVEFSAADVQPTPGSTHTPSQLDAINRAAGSPDLFLVLGPPGTGKTTVILAWVQHFVAQGMRVLVTSQSNKAVDNVLERLVRDEAIECVRLGQESKVSSSMQRYLIDNCAADLQERLLASVSKALGDIGAGVRWANEAEEVLIRNVVFCNQTKALIDAKTLAAVVLEKATSRHAETVVHNAYAQQQVSNRLTYLSRLELRFTEIKRGNQWFPWRLIHGRILKARALWNKLALNVAYGLASKAEVRRIDAYAVLTFATLEFQKAAEEFNTAWNTLIDSLPHVPEVGLPIHFCPWRHIAVLPSVHSAIRQIQSDREKLQHLIRYVRRWCNAVGESRQESLYSQLIASVDVVGATCIGIHTSGAFREVDFDLVIADECGQIQIHDLMVPLARAPKVIMVGDHKQLPPVVAKEFLDALEARYVDHNGLATNSWFEQLWDQLPPSRRAMLETQFRCPAVISDFISDAFYAGKYHAWSGVKSTPLFSFFTSPLVFIDTSNHRSRGESRRPVGDRMEISGNPLETAVVMAVLERALSENPEVGREGEIGIIAPYANHVSEIQRSLSNAFRKGKGAVAEISLPVRDIAATVDSFQGQERDLMIVALSRCNASGNVGFLSDWRRINVAITRTRHQLVLVGDFATLVKRRGSTISHEEDEFKVAMQKLKDHVRMHGQMIPASVFVPER
jgi:hypothetical protein